MDIEHCPISSNEVNRALAELRDRNPRDGHYTLRTSSSRRVFSQTNDEIANSLRDLVVDLVPADQDLLIDAYCGAGFFAKALLDKFRRVIGIDWDKFAIAAANEDATDKENYIAGDVEEELARPNLTALSSQVSGSNKSASPAMTLIVDPPATGLSTGVRHATLDLASATLIYVSCNPSTLARDLKELKERFTIHSVIPLDMFPQTAEIEVVAHLHA